MKQKCDLAHTDRCGQCEALEELLDSIQHAIQEAEFSAAEDRDRDEALYLFHHAREAINLWKCHQIRTVRQDQARLDVLDRLDEQTCLITNDWAMKFLPQRYRETQSDWFGKRGISWHISVVVRRVSGQLQTQTFVHILQSSDQGSSTIVLLLEHVLRSLKTENPEIQHAYFRQDNAGATTVPRRSSLYLPSSRHLECLSLRWTFQTPREERVQPTVCQQPAKITSEGTLTRDTT